MNTRIKKKKDFAAFINFINDIDIDGEYKETALEIANDLMNGELYVFDNGATHFVNLSALSYPPRWTKTFDKVTKIGSHTFYRM
jgi:spore germination cell wall hydrolase CwlJ-like protein